MPRPKLCGKAFFKDNAVRDGIAQHREAIKSQQRSSAIVDCDSTTKLLRAEQAKAARSLYHRIIHPFSIVKHRRTATGASSR